jgi:3-hydroxy-9,10-secoandrosta-1,3,5(10)-triene-9,17-dione monooxygenase reductase component
MAVANADFRKVMGHFATGITVVTATLPDGRRFGFTVNAFSSVSLNPPLVLVCVVNGGEAEASMNAATHFAVNILADDQENLSRQFSSRVPDRYEGVHAKPSASGAPLLEGCIGYLECRKTAAHAAGDHTILVGEVLAAEARDEGLPLLYFRSGYRKVCG